MTDPGAGESSSRFSIILPTYNRPERLAACLDAIAGLRHDSFEVVVVDDGSRTPAAEVVGTFSERMTLTVLRQENSGPARARNRGAAAARGRWLAFTDDDCQPDPDWLTSLERALDENPDALVGGVSRNAVTRSVFSEASQNIVGFLYEHAAARNAGFEFFTSNNMACARDLFLACGGFDESFPLAAGEDREFGIRWGRQGRPLVLAPDAKIDHWHHLTARGFWRQQSNYGRGAFHLRRRLVERREASVPFAGVQFYSGLLSYPFRHGARRPVSESALIALSQMAMTAGYLREWMGSTRRREGKG